MLLNSTLYLTAALAEQAQIVVLFETVTLALINVTAILWNLLVCGSVFRNKRLRTVPNTFVVALAISDILTSSLAMPLSVGVLSAGNIPYGPTVCRFQGFCIFTFGLISLQIMGIIALNRYVKICCSRKHDKLFTHKSTRLLVTAIWATALVASIPPFFLRWEHYTFQPRKAMCLIPFESNIGFTVFVELVYVAGPLFLITACYIQVFRAVGDANRALTSDREGTTLRLNVEESRVTKTLVTVFVGFAFCWIPITVIDYIDAASGESKLHRLFYLFYGFLVYISSTINPFIYGFMNQRFRQEYKQIVLGLLRNSTDRNEQGGSSVQSAARQSERAAWFKETCV